MGKGFQLGAAQCSLPLPFDEDDVRRDFVNQLFGYNNQGEAQLNNGRTNYNGKWSKLWNKNGLGSATEGNTGFNFPYMRYADVLPDVG